jgi:hypothetical protein
MALVYKALFTRVKLLAAKTHGDRCTCLDSLGDMTHGAIW